MSMSIRDIELMKQLNRRYYAELKSSQVLENTERGVYVNKHLWFVSKLSLTLTITLFGLMLIHALTLI